jgi:hypothetical protein
MKGATDRFAYGPSRLEDLCCELEALRALSGAPCDCGLTFQQSARDRPRRKLHAGETSECANGVPHREARIPLVFRKGIDNSWLR